MDTTIEKVERKIAGSRKPNRLKEASFQSNVWQLRVAPDITFEDVQQPDFWAHVSAQLKPCDRIEVIAEDFSFFGELMVVSADRLWAKTVPLRFVDLAAPVGADVSTPSLAAGYDVQYKGPTKKHVVIRLSDNTIVKDEIPTKAEAQRWIVEHVQALTR